MVKVYQVQGLTWCGEGFEESTLTGYTKHASVQIAPRYVYQLFPYSHRTTVPRQQ